MLLDLVYYGDPRLRTRAKEVDLIDPSVRELVYNMIETADHYKGSGLAAPQIGISLRVFVSRLNDSDESYEEWKKAPMEVFINPQLIDPSEKLVRDTEGCLSIPGIRGRVERPDSIRIQATDLEGCFIDRVYHGYLARQLMHENDHLNGVLYLDRMAKNDRKALQPDLHRMQKRYVSK